MKTIGLSTLVVSAFSLAACATIPSNDSEELASASIQDRDREIIGSAVLVSDGESLALAIDLNELAPGSHGFHLHTRGDCSAPDFTSAGGHLNPAGVSHGKLNPSGAHLGDLPNLEIGESGSLSQTIRIVEMSEDTLQAILDEDGTAIVVHAGPDDYVSDPAGAAGPRIACGVLQPI